MKFLFIFAAILAVSFAKEDQPQQAEQPTEEKKQTKRGLLDLGYGYGGHDLISEHALPLSYDAHLPVAAPIIKSYAPAISYAHPAPIIAKAPLISYAPAPIVKSYAPAISYAAPLSYDHAPILKSYAAPAPAISYAAPLSYDHGPIFKSYAAPVIKSYAAPAISYAPAPILKAYAAPAPVYAKSYAAPLSLGGYGKWW